MRKGNKDAAQLAPLVANHCIPSWGFWVTFWMWTGPGDRRSPSSNLWGFLLLCVKCGLFIISSLQGKVRLQRIYKNTFSLWSWLGGGGVPKLLWKDISWPFQAFLLKVIQATPGSFFYRMCAGIQQYLFLFWERISSFFGSARSDIDKQLVFSHKRNKILF